MLKEAMGDLQNLPPGFRFHPTYIEVISYLRKKVLDIRFVSIAIDEVDLNKCEPCDLPSKAKIGGKEWYFFCKKDRKYPTGKRTNRATQSGYWKSTGKDMAIHKGKGNLIGMKKTLVFHTGRAPTGQKTDWVMHEFRLEGKFYKNLRGTEKDEWVVCRVIDKTDRSSDQTITTNPIPSYPDNHHDLYDPHTLPPLIDPSYLDTTTTTTPNSICNNNHNSCSTDHTNAFINFSPNRTSFVLSFINQTFSPQFTYNYNVLQPNGTSFIPSSTNQTFTPQFTFNYPYTTNPSSSNYHPQYPLISTTSTNQTPIIVNNFQYLHQGSSTVNGSIDPIQTIQTKGKEEESLDFPFTHDHIPEMHRSQSTEDLIHLLTFDGYSGDIENIWKY